MAVPVSRSTYFKIAAALAVLTAVEFAALYIDGLRPILLPALFGLAVAKFVLVVQFFMHLRFEKRVLGWLFVGGLALSFAIWYGTWAIFYYRVPSTLP